MKVSFAFAFLLFLPSVSPVLYFQDYAKLTPTEKQFVYLFRLQQFLDGNLSLNLTRSEALALRELFADAAASVNESRRSELIAIIKKPAPPVFVRTIQECLWARLKDWETFIWANAPNVDPNADDKTRNEILDRLKDSPNSWQNLCLRGVVNQTKN